MYETSKLKIVQWNCFKLTDSRLIEFEMFLKIFDPDIISIQEIKLNTNLANLYTRVTRLICIREIAALIGVVG